MNPAKQQHLQLQLSGECNLRCSICPYELVGGRGYMSLKTLEAVLRNVCDSHYEILTVFLHLQGEPLVDAELPMKIRLIQQSLTFRNFRIATNASLAYPTMVARLLDALGDTPTELRISMLWSEPMQYKMQTGTPWRPSFDGAVRLLLATDDMPQITRKFVYYGDPGTLRKKVYGRLRGKGIKRLPGIYAFQKPSRRAGSVVAPNLAPSAGRTGASPCWQLSHFTHVVTTGQVIPCCQDWERRIILGDLTQEPLHEIIKRIPLVMREAAKDSRFPCRECECPMD